MWKILAYKRLAELIWCHWDATQMNFEDWRKLERVNITSAVNLKFLAVLRYGLVSEKRIKMTFKLYFLTSNYTKQGLCKTYVWLDVLICVYVNYQKCQITNFCAKNLYLRPPSAQTSVIVVSCPQQSVPPPVALYVQTSTNGSYKTPLLWLDFGTVGHFVALLFMWLDTNTVHAICLKFARKTKQKKNTQVMASVCLSVCLAACPLGTKALPLWLFKDFIYRQEVWRVDA